MRLTKRDRGGNARKNCEDCEIKFSESCCSKQLCLNALIEKLAAYEDAEEQGRLVMLPEKLYDSYEWDVTGVRYYDGKVTAYCVKNEQVESIIYGEEIGKTVFLTREEAKAALKGERKDDELERKMLEGMRLLQEGCDDNLSGECVNCPFDKYCTALMDAELIDPFAGINFQKEDGEAVPCGTSEVCAVIDYDKV